MKVAQVCRRPIDLVISAPKIALVLAAALLCTACGKKADDAESATYRYEARGLIRRLPPDHKTIEVQHEDIPGFMPSMMMPFEVRDEKEIASLKLGDAISFRLNVTQRDSWIDRIKKIDPDQLHLPIPASTPPPPADTGAQSRLHEGDADAGFQVDRPGRETGRLGNVSRSSFRRDLHFHPLPAAEFLPADVAEFFGVAESDPGFIRFARGDTPAQHQLRSAVRHARGLEAIRPSMREPIPRFGRSRPATRRRFRA